MRSKLCWQHAEQGFVLANAEQTSLASCFGRTRPAVLSFEKRCSEVKHLLHQVEGCRLRAFVRREQQKTPVVSRSRWSPLKGEEGPLH